MKLSRAIELRNPAAKVGRNDLCPCGSGKKYKKCHLLEKPQEFITPPDKSGWISSLLDWATLQPWYFSNFEKFLHKMLGTERTEINEDELKYISETLLFEVKVSNGKTPLELYIEEVKLEHFKHETYKDWVARGKFGAWEVLEVSLGKGCKVREFSKKDEYFISEQLGSYSIESGDIIVARILPFAGEWMFAGGVMAKLPQVWVYELKKNKMSFFLTSQEFLEIWFGRKSINDHDYKTYEQLKTELERFIETNELPFDLTNFDQRFQETDHPTVFFYPLFKSLYGFPELTTQVSEIIYQLWKIIHIKEAEAEAEQIGPIETALVRDFGEYCCRRFQKKEIIEPKIQRELSIQWKEEWLKIFQKALGSTPQEALAKERQELGNPSVTFECEATMVFWPKRWNDASTVHRKGLEAFKNNKFYEAKEYFEEVVSLYKDFPNIYRTIANLAMSEKALGNKQKAVSYLEDAIKINPRYSFAKDRLSALKGMSEKKVRETA